MVWCACTWIHISVLSSWHTVLITVTTTDPWYDNVWILTDLCISFFSSKKWIYSLRALVFYWSLCKNSGWTCYCFRLLSFLRWKQHPWLNQCHCWLRLGQNFLPDQIKFTHILHCLGDEYCQGLIIVFIYAQLFYKMTKYQKSWVYIFKHRPKQIGKTCNQLRTIWGTLNSYKSLQLSNATDTLAVIQQRW